MATVYYVDPTNAADDTATGLKYTGLTVDSSADTTHLTDAGLNAKVIPNGSFVWDTTRGAGSLTTAWDDGTDTLTLGTAIAGMAAGDSYYIITPWKTVGKATTTIAAGDIAYVRAGTTNTLAAVINCTNDGTAAAYCSIIGMGTGSATLETTDGTATEAWHDASTTRPIIDGNNGDYYFNLTTDNFWNLRNIDVRNTNSASDPCVYIGQSSSTVLSNCVVRDQANSNGKNIVVTNAPSTVVIENCDIKNSNGINILCTSGGILKMVNSTVDSGALDSTTGLSLTIGALVYLDNCTFGGVSTHSTADIAIDGVSKVYAKNCKFNSTKATFAQNDITSNLFEEDAGQVYGANITSGYLGIATKSTTVTRTGGADSSVKIVPASYVGVNRPFTLRDFPNPSFRVYASTTPSTIAVYLRTYSSWAAYPTTAGLWVEAEYVSSSSGGRTTVSSTAVLSSTETWVAFSNAVAPAVPSFVNLTLFMATASSSGGVYVDPKPVFL